MDTHEEVLVAIRQIIRAIDLHSKRLNKDYGLTSPQLLLMRSIQQEEDVTIRQLSEKNNMSQATATSILDRLESRGFVIRERDARDKRKVHALLTSEGREILDKAPGLMEEGFTEQFRSLPLWEQNLLLSCVQRLSNMMNAPGACPEPAPPLFNYDQEKLN